jgi:hypothetical protein
VPSGFGFVYWYLRHLYSHPHIADMTDLEPDFPTAEELEAYAKRAREGTALWMWNDDYFETFRCGWKSGLKQKRKR